MRILYFTALSAGIASLLACTPNGDFIAIRHATVITATDAPPLNSATILVAGHNIVEVGPDGDVSVPRSATVIDATGQFVIPGLWEMHAHLSKTRASAMGLFVANGVTTVRDMGGDHEELLGWRREVAQGDRIGPRMLLAGPYLESTRNVERMRNTPVEEMIEPVERTRIPVGSPAEARRVVDSIAQLELDYIKIRTVQDSATYRAIADAAQTVDLDLVGHVTFFTPELILAAGQRGVDHFLFPTLDDRTRDERMTVFTQFADADIGAVPTLVTLSASVFAPDSLVRAVMEDSLGVSEPRRAYLSKYLVDDWREQALERDTSQLEFFRQVYGSTLRNLREMREAGVRIMAGSDVAVLMIFPGSTLHDELALFVTELGMTPMEAIESATRLPAEFLGLADSTGTIEGGKVADLLILDADPLTDITNTRRIVSVVLRGELFTAADLDMLLAGVISAPDQRINDWPRTHR